MKTTDSNKERESTVYKGVDLLLGAHLFLVAGITMTAIFFYLIYSTKKTGGGLLSYLP